jgi:DeoR/GlpR family transcriptional regulator of sugar metabolism
LAVASELQFSRSVQTVLLGGLIRRGSPDLTGSVTEGVLDMFAADIAFQGADGIGLDGSLYNADMGLARVDRKMRQQAERMYILADSSKIGKTALVRQSFLQDVDGLITDSGIAPGHRKAFKQLGVNVIVVSTAG